MTKVLYYFSMTVLLLSCSTTPKITVPPEQNKANGFWEAKAQIKDLATLKTHQVSLDMTIVAPDQLRVDVTGTMGVSVASIIVNKNDVAYVLYRQKKFYQGIASERALKPVFNIDLNPRALLNISLDKPIEEPGWSCVIDGAGLVESCANDAGITIQWKDRNSEQKRVLVAGKTFELQLVYKSYSKLSSKVLSNPQVFRLEAPSGFARYEIP